MNTKTETVKHTPSKRFLELARLLLDIMIEGGDGQWLPKDFKMPKAAILKTALELESAFNDGKITEDENRALYYSGMTEDYGGEYEKEIYKYEKQPEVKHTPLPYYVSTVEGNNAIMIGADDGSDIIADMRIENKKAKANAKFLVKAVNNHYQLLEALKEITDMALRWSVKGLTPTIHKAEQAIKNAEL